MKESIHFDKAQIPSKFVPDFMPELPAVWERPHRLPPRLSDKESACSQPLGQEDSPREGNGNRLQSSCLENLMDRGVWGLQPIGSQRVGHY